MSHLGSEALAVQLEATGDYRVLRRLKFRKIVNPPDDSPKRRAIFLDLETTGLDPAKNEIIEIGMVPFTYGVDGRIYEIGEPFARLRQPKEPISQEITALTGITNEMVEGKSIDLVEVSRELSKASLVIAHNAAFDRLSTPE